MWSFFEPHEATRSTLRPRTSALRPARLRENEGWTVGPNVDLKLASSADLEPDVRLYVQTQYT